LKADRGGFISDPHVGVFEDVVEFDFPSMYPNIMVTRNVSPETILCDCCDPDDEDATRVPQIGYHTCERSGFIGRAPEPLIDRRETFKRLRREHPDERDRYQAAVDAIKWLAVCSFGYQGYKNARFGRIECHEAICAWSREILLTCSEIAREEGFEIVHGIVDSVWLERTEPWADPERLAERVTEALDIELEGRYDWIVFLSTRSYAMGLDPEAEDEIEAAGALNRFYGCFSAPPDAPSRSQAGQDVDYIEEGRVKVRGVELRQRSCPSAGARTGWPSASPAPRSRRFGGSLDGGAQPLPCAQRFDSC
jgi:DNA polymerase elongation subunit (family B)